MRTFKFRAWDNNQMYYQVRCGGIFDGIPTAPTAWEDNFGDWCNLTGQPHTTIMQYAGVQDDKGKEVYEYDVVMYGDDSVDYICFDNGCFCTANSGYLLDEIGDFEVIGHLFDEYWKNSIFAKQIR